MYAGGGGGADHWEENMYPATREERRGGGAGARAGPEPVLVVVMIPVPLPALPTSDVP